MPQQRIDRVRANIGTYPGSPAEPVNNDWETSINHNDGDRLIALFDAVDRGSQQDIDKALADLKEELPE